MRAASVVVGVCVAVAVALWVINHRFTAMPDTGIHPAAISSSNASSTMISTLSLTSSAFENNASIPSKFTCDASPPDGGNPALYIEGVPVPPTKSLVLIVDDPDIPSVAKERLGANEFVHWILFNIPPDTKEIPENGSVGVVGANSAGKSAYAAPCPPKEYEPSEHRYFFTLYALDIELHLSEGATRADVAKAMVGHIVAETQLVGRYKRK